MAEKRAWSFGEFSAPGLGNLPLDRVRLRRKPEGPVFESPRAHHFFSSNFN
jgi:hypothetical protein